MSAFWMSFFDLFGTVVFAVTGALSGVRLRLDLLGVIVFGCTVGVGGGILRDLIIGDIPVAALQNETYLLGCIAVSLLTFFAASPFVHHRNAILVFDAFGLGIFTAIGAAKGIQFGIGPVGTILCGILSAVGGGLIRDVLARKVPLILVSDFYATAALGGALLFVALHRLQVADFPLFCIVALFVIAVRLAAIRWHLQLPSFRKRRRL
ncbi:MAG: trimeric intracellular cation channel family protein [Victivallaceae bacterium]|nr:trimeric intracellular cation channel family protein [Victivallaceae bacterium]